MAELTLTVTREISARIEDVYNAWLDPQTFAKFMIPGSGMTVLRAKIDAREGGRFDIVMANGDKEFPHGGVYKTLNPYSQIIFSWEAPLFVDGSTVTLNLFETGGKTRIELIHVKFADEESCADHNAGWEAILTQLDAILATRN